ncbi:hypothetical protein GJAV_G00002130 [Gymnothorax javanicus]|nr:hypothetical protein GJAV_G00002130 [Gymnothorax javanicus]
MSTFSAEDIGFTFLEKGSSVADFIQQKTEELSKRGSLDAFFVVELGEILRKHLRWVRAMPRVKPLYAVKCNDKYPVVKMLALLGTGFDCASQGSLDAFFVVELGEILRKHLRWVRAMPLVKPFYAVKCNDKYPVVKMLALLGTGFDCASQGSLDAFFVVDLGEILRKHFRWVRAMPRVKPFYAVKCNDKYPVVKMLALLGTGFDCASQPEFELMKSLDVDPSRIIYANTIKQVSHLKYAADYGIEMMTFDTVAELDRIATHHKNAKLVLRIFADNSDSVIVLSNKFGARLKECPMLLEAAKNLGLNVIGVSFHVGSLCSNSDAYRKAIKDGREVFDMAAKLGYSMNLVDIGGGFPGYDVPDLFVFQEFANVINKSLEKHFPDPAVQVIAEPGRYYPESSFTLATNIIGKKVAMKMHDDGKFEKKRTLKEATYPSTIFGQTCDGHDQIVEKYPLPNLEIGEWLLFYNMGAYTVTLFTDFNGFKKPDIHYMLSQEAWQRIEQIAAGVTAEEANDVLDEPNHGKPGPARIRYCLKTRRPILE